MHTMISPITNGDLLAIAAATGCTDYPAMVPIVQELQACAPYADATQDIIEVFDVAMDEAEGAW